MSGRGRRSIPVMETKASAPTIAATFVADPVADGVPVQWLCTLSGAVSFRAGTSEKWVPVEGAALLHVAVAPSGAVWGCTAEGTVYFREGVTIRNPGGSRWTKVAPGDMPHALIRIAAGKNSVWAVAKGGPIYSREGVSDDNPMGTRWRNIDGGLTTISVGPAGHAYGTNVHTHSYYRAGDPPHGTGWSQMSMNFVRMAIGERLVWGLSADGGIYWREGIGHDAFGQWRRIDGALTDIAVGGGGQVWGVNAQQQVFVRRGITAQTPAGTAWARVENGQGSSIAVGFLSKPPTSTAACQQSLQSDLAELFSGGLYSDVVIAVGGREFPAHRGVLAARSAFFRAMFAAQMRESQTGKVLLDDVEPRVFSHVLKFVYTATFSLEPAAAEDDSDGLSLDEGKQTKEGKDSDKKLEAKERPAASATASAAAGDSKSDGKSGTSTASTSSASTGSGSGSVGDIKQLMEVIEAGDRFQVVQLVRFCEQQLAAWVRADTWAELFAFSRTRDLPILKDACTRFAAQRSYLEAALKSEGFQQLDSDALRDILAAVVVRLQ